MSAALSEEQNQLIKNVAKSEGFEDYKIKVTSGSMKGDGYLGIIKTVDLQEVSKPTKELHLVIKSAITGEKLREQTPVKKAYEREIYMYTDIFPQFRKLADEVGITTRFTETAKCFGSSLKDEEECLLLENLKEIHFKLWNRKEPMDEDHIALAFQSYAKFHATGLVLRNLKPEKFQEIEKNMANIFHNEDGGEEEKRKAEGTFKSVLANGFEAVTGNEEATKKLTEFGQNCFTFFVEEVHKMDKYCTVLHGDCWCNNMMFKYNDLRNPSKPTEMRFLDWQIAHVGSPILDLSYFLYACGSKETFQKLKKFLKIYHENFSKVLEEAGIEEIFTFEELEMQWKRFSKYGLFMALFVMKVILSEVEEAPDLSKMAEAGHDIVASIAMTNSVNIDAVNKRISDVVVFMCENEYL